MIIRCSIADMQEIRSANDATLELGYLVHTLSEQFRNGECTYNALETARERYRAACKYADTLAQRHRIN